jgi:DNA repair exonuclease SbcCD nuclease subunit
MARFLCTGDLHLGAGADLGNAPGERLAEQEAVWLSIVKMANELEATILFAGDAWERRRPTPAELLAFFRPIERARIGPLVITGNHDVEAYDRPTGYDVRGHWHRHRPDVVSIGGALVACLPWAPPGKLIALDEGGDRDAINARLADGLVDVARGLYVEAEARKAEARKRQGALGDFPVILLAHWSVGGAQTPTGVPVELFREPVLPLEDLAAIGFDVIVLGHIHKPQILSDGFTADRDAGAPPIFYVGSPMPLNFGEAESEHVVWLLDFDQPIPAIFQIPVESRRLVTLDVDLRAHPVEGYVFVSEQADVGGAIVKAKVRATPEQARRLDVSDLRRGLLDGGAHKVWSVQVDVEREQIARGVEIDETVDDVEAFTRWLDSQETGASMDGLWRDGLLDAHRDYLQEVNR